MGLRTLPPVGMKEAPARPFSPALGKSQPSLRCQHRPRHPQRQEDLGTGVAEAPTKQKASRLTDQPTSLHPLFLLSPFPRSTSLAEDRECKAPKVPQKEYPDTRQVDRGRGGREWEVLTHPTPPPTHIKPEVYGNPQSSGEDWTPKTHPLRFIPSFQVWTTTPFTSRHQETIPSQPLLLQ